MVYVLAAECCRLGIPQGPVLGNHLFISYVNDMCDAIGPSNAIQLDDGPSILLSDDGITQPKPILTPQTSMNVSSWFYARVVCFNLEERMGDYLICVTRKNYGLIQSLSF